MASSLPQESAKSVTYREERESLTRGEDKPRDSRKLSYFEPSPELKVYKRRWIMLLIFVWTALVNAFQWIQFAVISTLMVEYYGVDDIWIDSTSLIFCYTFIPFIFPATYLLQLKGLRLAILLGSFGTAFGSWIKMFTAAVEMFPLAFAGQTIVAVSQIFILEIPPLLAAVWFGPDQVSTATAIGVFGNQVGIALGFLIPPMLVKNGTTEEIYYGLQVMHYGTGAVCGLVFLSALFFFQDKPPKPPSMAQAALIMRKTEENYLRSLKNLVTNKAFVLHFFSYGFNLGIFLAVSTLLNDFILKYWPGCDEDVGKIGLSILLCGIVGSIVSGYILDQTRKYKETTLANYALSIVVMFIYTFTLPYTKHLYVMYLVMSVLGFFMTGYLTVGFEYGAEITYPESEGMSAGLLNCSSQIFAIVMTIVTRAIFKRAGDVAANLTLCGVLLVGLVMTALIRSDSKRLAAQKNMAQGPRQRRVSVVNEIIRRRKSIKE